MNEVIAQKEYARLLSLTKGRHPFGDCQLVALMIARAIDGEIIEGDVDLAEGRQIWHYWAVKSEHIYDPLAENWEGGRPQAYYPRKHISEKAVLDELAIFVNAIERIPNNYVPIWPLRYVLSKELLGVDVPRIEKLALGPVEF